MKINAQHNTRVHRTTHAVSDGAQFVERLDVEPGALVSGRVQHHPHGVLLQQSGKTLVHRQVLVALQVEQLGHTHTGKRFTSSSMKSVHLQLLCEGVKRKKLITMEVEAKFILNTKGMMCISESQTGLVRAPIHGM